MFLAAITVEQKIRGMYKKHQFYCVTPEWQQKMAESLNGTFLDEKMIIFPESLGKGHTFFIQVTPGIAVIVMDFVLSSQLKINRIEDDTNRYVVHFDLSDQENEMHYYNTTYKIGNNLKTGLSIFKNQGNYHFEPATGKRVFALRLFIDELLMNELIENNPSKKLIEKRIGFGKQKKCVVDIDGDSLLLLTKLKETSIEDPSYDVNLKGLSLRLVSNVLLKLAKKSKKEIASKDIDGILKAEQFILDNLYNSFPSIQMLAQIACMSETKFKTLFKKHFKKTSQKFFHEEKMSLAQKKMQSGEYTTLTEIIQELNYSQLSHFSTLYFNFFSRKPLQDFVKKSKQ
ncbi:helix-turn-helix domain-containing protein [Flavobacterium daemonense]|uniref:helix-turn-helix domain-containing protein n=1 Tax=Flavobacterium daemonense TaxID=1393049 RepID=UPI001186BB9A|nr:AraC family transcriptional regulator [Flavobacterium daemonense]KAF2325782.1 helix-turn-helix transcriptional regulator [Flavobacterium daemonense]